MRFWIGRGPMTLLMLVTVILSACAPAAPRTETPSAPGAPVASAPATPKTVTIGIQREPHTMDQNISGGGSLTAGGASNVPPILHNSLSVNSGSGGFVAQLAAEMPSVERGTWRVNQDGSMDMTWKLRPNVKWHDGTPFTSADMTFMFEVRKALGNKTSGAGRPELMESASAPDALTFVVHWTQVYVRADEATGLDPLPRHLLDEVYRADKDAVATSRYFTSDFVGLGPYKLQRWEQGAFIEAVRFDEYFLGRPAIDRVLVQFVPDPNALIANILGEALDVVVSDSVDVPTALEVRQRWEGSGNQVTFAEIGGLHQLELQHRPEFARPREGFTNRAVRQALYHAIDRATFAEVFAGGVAPVADSWYSPSSPLRKDLEPNIPQFPYDLARAQQLLTQAGWVRGPDGALVYGESRERFETAIMAKATTGTERALNVIADGWKQVGVQTTFDILTRANQDDREYQSTRPGPYFTSPSGDNFYDNRLHTSVITRPETRWTGTNRGGYINPRVDVLLDRLALTVDQRERLPLHRELLKEQMEDLALMPLVWEVMPLLVRKDTRGPRLARNEGTLNIHEWSKQ